MKVKFKKMVPGAVVPKKSHPSDAGFDLTVTSVDIDKNGAAVCGFGIAVEIPEGYLGLVFPRSSIAKKDILLSNAVGIIDSNYRGEIMAKFKPTFRFSTKYVSDSSEKMLADIFNYTASEIYGVGERAAQLVIVPYPEIEFEEVEELSQTERGEGGYGSTGT